MHHQALIKQHETQLAEQQQQIQSFKTEVASLKASLEEARVKSLEDEATRKKLHNTIQELKVPAFVCSLVYLYIFLYVWFV